MTPKSWRKSSRSNSGPGQCVEVGTLDGTWIAVRDSKLTTTVDFPTLTVPATDWASLLTDIQASHLD
ncbi:uncharacterized protein DUF397 [Stackebrandtia endophytica]|uniref:Uncharacterized protein DUF397 n=1 Tax=Stackebrandtia endophytica TaxID=1496996 RepID=A0A543AXB7_9ACTN|nr:DUF397 domain-containing protein [Stackebrandtia endophytica]TQL77222.1 uncharacterized protein DUF397 [Stackebrandtia endophytica]